MVPWNTAWMLSYNRPSTSSEYKTLSAVDTESRHKQVVSKSYLIGCCLCWIRHCLVLWWLGPRAKCLAARVPRCRSAHLQHGLSTCGHPSGGQHPFSLGRSSVESYDRLHAGTLPRQLVKATDWKVNSLKPGRSDRFFCKVLTSLWSPLIFVFSGYRWSFPGAERPEREVYHSSPSNAVNKWSYSYTPAICLRRVDKEQLTIHEWMQAVESFIVNTRFEFPSSALLKTEAGEDSSLLRWQALTLEIYSRRFEGLYCEGNVILRNVETDGLSDVSSGRPSVVQWLVSGAISFMCRDPVF